ncbi:hypothetical protein [Tolumonas lignilytica]|uniref:hypothetical protein n=1 Tax=Tolumonas lignilytica TaxID=1283284 RepID=UPI0004654313|nr:hypothetical protein [Tolumonas lignilytica]
MSLSQADVIAYLQIAGDIIGCAAVVAASLPHPSEKANLIIKILRGFLDVVAANVGHAANSAQPVTQPTQNQDQSQQ